ncbi:hypothetical protein AN4790.2 [Aspergillus nidulans FGSC A4]|nr:hypothetical protein AN4790.2 [Aspergillus nidulans FGSC A4]|eukprot:XP_662394.1 hypothetical protein AN4790.2 [Aspergillus nidulans FGSC A4]
MPPSKHRSRPVPQPADQQLILAPWRAWESIAVHLSNVTAGVRTLDLWRAFKDEGNVRSIDIFENFQGNRTTRARIRLIPNPEQTSPGTDFWKSAFRRITLHNGKSIYISMSLGKKPPNWEVSAQSKGGSVSRQKLRLRFRLRDTTKEWPTPICKWIDLNPKASKTSSTAVQDPFDTSHIHLPFAVRYLLEARKLFEHVTLQKKTYYNPDGSFRHKSCQEGKSRKNTVLLLPDISNCVIRRYANLADNFLRVRFTDAKHIGRIHATVDNTMDEVLTRIKRALANGITIGSTRYEFLAFGNSSSCFSTTRAISGCTAHVKKIDDIEGNGYIFSDGVGRISKFLAQIVKSELKIKTPTKEPPSAYQFRLVGCKGMLIVFPQARPQEVHIRKSQFKFAALSQGLEIIRWSQFTVASLNRQLILVLSTLGITDKVFHLKLKTMLRNLDEAMESDPKAAHLLRKYVDPNQVTLTIYLPKNGEKYEIIEGICILARNPSLHPGGIRVVRAVNAPGLHHLKDIVVLPRTGDRDIASMCSGSDLDGDDFLVIWDQDLLPDDWFRSFQLRQLPTRISHGVITLMMVSTKQNAYGSLSYTQKPSTTTRQLYDAVGRIDFGPNIEMDFDKRILNCNVEVHDAIYGFARRLKDEYDIAIRRITAQHEIKTEFEVWLTYYKFHEDIGAMSLALRENFKKRAFEKVGGRTFDALAPLAVAMYRVTYQEMATALAKHPTTLSTDLQCNRPAQHQIGEAELGTCLKKCDTTKQDHQALGPPKYHPDDDPFGLGLRDDADAATIASNNLPSSDCNVDRWKISFGFGPLNVLSAQSKLLYMPRLRLKKGLCWILTVTLPRAGGKLTLRRPRRI